jgi:hypothetical protein
MTASLQRWGILISMECFWLRILLLGLVFCQKKIIDITIKYMNYTEDETLLIRGGM